MKTIAHAAAHLRTALAMTHPERSLERRTTLVVGAWLQARDLARVIYEVVGEDREREERERFLVVDRAGIEALARRYPWVWRLELAAIAAAARPLRRLPVGYVEVAASLENKGHAREALAALRLAVAMQRAETPRGEVDRILDRLAQVESNMPWSLLTDVARAIRPLWRWSTRSRDEESPALWRWWLSDLAREILRVVVENAWAETLSGSVEESLGLRRLLRMWRSSGAESVASDFADSLRKRLQRHGASPAIVDRAWNDTA